MPSFFATHYTVEITCADTAAFIKKLTDHGVTIRNLRPVDPLIVRLELNDTDYQIAVTQADILGAKVKIVQKKGAYVAMSILKKRVVLFVGLMIILFLTLYIPGKVLFVIVEGNERVEEQRILDCAEQVGVGFGASRSAVRSEQIKNALLQAMPELRWAGVNTYGCVAVISVLERDLDNRSGESGNMVQGIYATRAGVISSITATKGTPLCKPGQAVSEQQLLISGYTDCGLLVRAEQANGLVRAITKHDLQAVIPAADSFRGEITDRTTKWSIQIGKKRLKLYIDSGNSTTGCGKIYKTYELRLPGGFVLPVSLVVQTQLFYLQAATEREQPDPVRIEKLASNYISGCMDSGVILNTESSFTAENNAYMFTGVYTCEEQIGKLRNEEIG